MNCRIPDGRFYIDEPGFRARKGIMIPFTRLQYHLQDWRDISQNLSNQEELNNLLGFALLLSRYLGLAKGSGRYSD
jgi:hypothetical protein